MEQLKSTDFDVFNVNGQFWKPEPDKWYSVVLSNWNIVKVKFAENEPEKPRLSFDVLNIDGVEYTNPPKKWGTGSRDFIQQIRPILLNAQDRGLQAVLVKLMRTGKTYVVVEVPRG